MKTCLIISYHFPPAGGVAVQRVLKFVKYLPEFGWNPVVLTAFGDYYQQDELLLDQVPPGVPVYRTYSFEPQRIYRRTKHLLTAGQKRSGPGISSSGHLLPRSNHPVFVKQLIDLIFTPDGETGWIPFSVKRGLKILQKHKVDLIYSNALPFSSHIVGLALSKISNKPWVADYRDVWTEDGRYQYSPLKKKINEWIESRVLRQCKAVIMATSQMVEAYKIKYRVLNNQKFTPITNGFDFHDFEDSGSSVSANQKMTFVFTGTIIPDGTAETFLRDVIELPEHIKRNIQINFVGSLYQSDESFVRQIPEKDLVIRTPFTAHREAIKFQKGADALLLIIGDHKFNHGFLPAKIFEYIACKKPILAVIPEGAAADLLRETGLGVIVNPKDHNAIRREIISLYEKFSNGTLTADVKNPSVLHQYERKELTGKLAGIFDNVVS